MAVRAAGGDSGGVILVGTPSKYDQAVESLMQSETVFAIIYNELADNT